MRHTTRTTTLGILLATLLVALANPASAAIPSAEDIDLAACDPPACEPAAWDQVTGKTGLGPIRVFESAYHDKWVRCVVAGHDAFMDDFSKNGDLDKAWDARRDAYRNCMYAADA